MKNLLPSTIILSLFFITISSAKVDTSKNYNATDAPLVFKDIDYRSDYRAITRCIPNLNDLGFNDKISSCQIPDGWTIIVYEHKDYCGKYYTITSDNNNFKYIGWNDCISSIEVYYNGKKQGYSYACPAITSPPPKRDYRDPNDHPKN